MSQSQPLRLKVLVVDDEPSVLDVAAELLSAEGHEVLRAATVREALAHLEAHRDIDLLFTDIVLSGPMDGFDLAETAKRRRPGLRVIYTSGYLRDEGVWEGTLLTKPWTEDDLRSAIADLDESNRPIGG